jgi:NAD(P)-dependent dehydrogenase (short-subunit alcohol dehydrogenase family)
MKKTILITGASRGFGKLWAKEFLKRGDNVIATARKVESLNDLINEHGNSILPLQLDVTSRAQCFEVVNKAYQHFGKLDVVINNAGYGLFGAIEEATEQDVLDQFKTNVFGSLWINQAAIPVMRQQGSGHIIQVSSVLGITAIPLLGIYNASKWAIEAISESMAQETKAFGIHNTLIEPIAYATDFSGDSAVSGKSIDAYDDLRTAVYKQRETMPFGKPEATAAAILKIVDAENPPLRIFFGNTALPWVKQVYADRLSEWEQWGEVSNAAHG